MPDDLIIERLSLEFGEFIISCPRRLSADDLVFIGNHLKGFEVKLRSRVSAALLHPWAYRRRKQELRYALQELERIDRNQRT